MKNDGSKEQFEFISAIKRLQELDSRARDFLLEGYDKDMEIMYETVHSERKLQTEATTLLEAAHQRQLHVMQDMMTIQQGDFDRNFQVLEERLSAKYRAMLKSLHDKVELEQECQVTRSVEALVRVARVETDLSRRAIDEQQRAEVAAAVKFQGMVGDMRKLWEEEESMRIRDVEQRLRSHFEMAITSMRAQVEMAQQLHETNDQQWMKDMGMRFRTQMETLTNFKNKCQRLYADRLTEYSELTRKQFSEFESKILDTGEVIVSSRQQMELTMRRMKQACSKWRYDYQCHMQTRVQETVSSIENMYLHETITALSELSEARETTAQKELERCKAEHQLQDELLAKQEREKEMREAEEKRALANAEAQDIYHSLCRLWEETATPAGQQLKTLKEIFLHIKFLSPELLESLRMHYEMISAMRPLLRLCSHHQTLAKNLARVDAKAIDAIDALKAVKAKKGRHRDLKERTRNFEKNVAEAQTNKMNSAAELQTFSLYIGKVLEEYESTYDTEFWYNSEWLLKRLRSEYRDYSIRTGHPPSDNMKDIRTTGHLDEEWANEISEVERWLTVARERKSKT